MSFDRPVGLSIKACLYPIGVDCRRGEELWLDEDGYVLRFLMHVTANVSLVL